LRGKAGALLQQIGNGVGGKGTVLQGVGQGAGDGLLWIEIA
jgi:hypothetical protein